MIKVYVGPHTVTPAGARSLMHCRSLSTLVAAAIEQVTGSTDFRLALERTALRPVPMLACTAGHPIEGTAVAVSAATSQSGWHCVDGVTVISPGYAE